MPMMKFHPGTCWLTRCGDVALIAYVDAVDPTSDGCIGVAQLGMGHVINFRQDGTCPDNPAHDLIEPCTKQGEVYRTELPTA